MVVIKLMDGDLIIDSRYKKIIEQKFDLTKTRIFEILTFLSSKTNE